MTPLRMWLMTIAVSAVAPAAYPQIYISGSSNVTLVAGGSSTTLTASVCAQGQFGCPSQDTSITFQVSSTAYGNFGSAQGGVVSNVTQELSARGGGTASEPFYPGNTAGSYTVRVTSGTNGAQATYQVTNLPAAAKTMAAVNPAQQAAVGTAFPSPLQVFVKDAYGNAVADGTAVMFTAPGSGASGTFNPGGTNTVTATTVGGVAAASFVANGAAGSYMVSAQNAACSCATSFALTNTAPASYQLSATASPSSYGSISASPQGSNASNSGEIYTATYNAGTMVQLTANPANGYGFDHWGGGGVNGSTANPVTVTMSAAQSVTAFFVQVVATTVTTSPPGLSITVDQQNYTSPQTFQWVQGVQHSIGTTSPQNSGNSRYTFSSWSDGGAITHTITVNFNPMTYTASFTGTQTSSPLSLSCGTPSGTAQVGVSYSVTCSALGGTAPYSFSLSSGTLPAGWNLSPGGSTVVIGGTASAAGGYAFTLQVTDSSPSVQTATQALSGTIAPAAGGLTVSPPSGLTFAAYTGRGNPATQMLSVSSTNGTVAFNVTNMPGWVQVSPSSGTAGASPVMLTVTALTASLGVGPQSGVITITPASGPPVTVNVSVNVSPFAIGAASPIAESVAAGAAKTDSVMVTTADGGAASVNASATMATGGTWLKLAVSTLSAPGPLGFTIDATNLSAGPYTGSIALTCGNANPCAAVTVTVNLTVTAGSSAVAIAQVLNATQEAATISQNTWIEIKGTNLAQTTRTWQASDFDPKTGLMPTALDGVSVTVNGKPAYVYYISSTQINVLTPIDSALGSVGVQVTNGAGSSNLFTVTMLQNSLGFFAFNSGKYAAAEHADGSYIGPATLYPGLSTPAKPGETIVLYANGFGETDPAITPGLAVQQGQLPHNPVITLGGLPMNVINAAVVSPGLYQFNAVVPQNAPSGDLALQASYNSFSTQSGVLLTVSH